jgi:hypothetical protein
MRYKTWKLYTGPSIPCSDLGLRLRRTAAQKETEQFTRLEQGTNSLFQGKEKEKISDLVGSQKHAFHHIIVYVYCSIPGCCPAARKPRRRDPPRSIMQHTAHRFFVRRAAKWM